MIEHFQNRGSGEYFAVKYYCYNLIYYEYFTDIIQAIRREKEIKQMSRQKKEKLIAKFNPNWNSIVVE